MTVVSSAAMRRANALPMLPSPTMPTVSPCSDPVTGPGTREAQVPARTSRSRCTILRFQASSRARAWLATSRIHTSGTLTTTTPSSVAAGTSITS